MPREGSKPGVLVETEVEGEFESMEFGEGAEKRMARSTERSEAVSGGTSSAPTEQALEALGGQDAEGTTSFTTSQQSLEDEALKELTATATKVAVVAKGVARDVRKVASQISQRVATAVNTAVEENSPISKLVGEVSTWWANLDPAAEGVDPNGEDPTTTSKMMVQLHEQYGLSEDEALLEQFKCKLLQSYKCTHNEFTPPMQMAFPVSLSIFEHHFCFCSEHHRKRCPIALPHAQVTRVEKQDNSGDPILSVTLANGNTIIWKGFDSDTALDSALALMEHLTGH